MAKYKLAWKDRWVRGTSPITGDTDCSIPIVYLEQDAPNRITYEWTGAQFTRLFSALKTGADLMFPEVANDILWDLLKGVHCAPELQPDESGCVEYPNAAPFIKYFPDNPFITGDVQAGWITEAWVRFGEFDSIFPDWIDEWITGQIEAFTGYQSTDILCNIASLPLNSIESFLENGGVLPKIEIRFSGTGTVELELLSFPLGGRAIIELDQEPNILDILTGGILDSGAFTVELDRDLASFPPEEYPINNVEIHVETGGDHVLYVVFVPVVNDTLIPIGMGGGLRSVELCGFEETPMAGIQNVIFEDCTLKIVVDGVPEEVQNFQDLYACVEALMATQAEIKQAIIDAQEEIAARFLSGQAGNVASGITIGADGTIEVSTEGAPADDPATTAIDEEQAAFMGGAVSLARGFELVLDKIDAYYGATNGTPTTSEQNAQFGIEAYFPCDDTAMNIGISNYYSYRASNNRILFNTSVTFERYLYCFGANAQGIKRYLVDQSGYDATKLSIVVRILEALSPEFFSDYYDAGVLVPSTDYIQAPCHKNDVEEWTQNWASADSFSYSFTQTWKANHRFLLEIEGSYADADEPNVVHDGLWKINTSTGVKTFIGFTLSVSGTTNVTALQAPYRSDHKYAVTIEKTGDNIGSWSVQNDTAAIPNVVGTTTFRFTDLGLII